MNSDMHDDAGRLTVLGWTTFALYMIAAVLSFRAAVAFSVRRLQSAVSSQWSSETGRIWIWPGVILGALGLNKALNLQTRLIKIGRIIAGDENLSAYRSGLHALFFAGFILAITASFVVVMLRLRAEVGRFGRQQPLAAGGFGLICAYIVIRAVSIDQLDLMLGFNPKPRSRNCRQEAQKAQNKSI